MKTIILTLSLLLSNFIYSQIGVITLKKNESVPLNMWYTIDEKDREDNLYITFEIYRFMLQIHHCSEANCREILC